MAERAISYPFKFNSIGGVNYTSDQEKIWRDRIAILCLTQIGERVMLPNYGTSVPRTAFENENDAVSVSRETIQEAFAQWLPELIFVDVTGSMDVDTNELFLEIYYNDPRGKANSVSIQTAVLSRFGDIIKEVRSG